MKFNIILVFIWLFVMLVGCQKKVDSPKLGLGGKGENSDASIEKGNLAERIDLEGKKFVSHSGDRLGQDGDVGLMFLPDQKIRLISWGYAIEDFYGSYSWDDSQKNISLSLPGFKESWTPIFPEMVKGRIYLRRVDGKTERGEEGGESIQPNFWPFAEVSD